VEPEWGDFYEQRQIRRYRRRRRKIMLAVICALAVTTIAALLTILVATAGGSNPYVQISVHFIQAQLSTGSKLS
jgi:type IV secretory pathway component VirB8